MLGKLGSEFAVGIEYVNQVTLVELILRVVDVALRGCLSQRLLVVLVITYNAWGACELYRGFENFSKFFA